MDDNSSLKKPWFRRKIFGWGWMPWVWQGWVITAIFILVIVLAADAFDLSLAFWIVVVIASVIFSLIATKKGEKPKWSWGYKDSRKESGGKEEKYKKYY